MACTASKVLEIAAAEVGYKEKKSNAQLEDKTANAGSNNYTKYARDFDEKYPNWYNYKKQTVAWCDMFVDWCFLSAFGYQKALELLCQPEKSAGAGCTYSAGYFRAKGQFYTSGPKPGDQIFFGSSINSCEHTGLVEKVENSKVYTIEGNAEDQVKRCTYSLNSSNIVGYGRPKYDATTTSSKKIYIDAGHGGDSTGASYNGRKEKDDCLALALAVGKLLEANGITVKYSRTTDVNPDLNDRCREANAFGANYFISIHRNAFKPEQAKGVEGYIWSKATINGPEEKNAKRIVNLTCTATGFKNRGIKRGAPSDTDFTVNKITTMPSVLLECGFIDNTDDNKIFDSKFKLMTVAIAEGLCDAVGVKYKDPVTTTPKTESPATSDISNKTYRVQVGAYKDKNNATAMLITLKKAGFDGIIVEA